MLGQQHGRTATRDSRKLQGLLDICRIACKLETPSSDVSRDRFKVVSMLATGGFEIRDVP